VPFGGSGERREVGEGRKRVVNATVPLGEMVGYLKHLRAMTQGCGTFVMERPGDRVCRGRGLGRRKKISKIIECMYNM
jgi:translation elongation factor EF-G